MKMYEEFFRFPVIMEDRRVKKKLEEDTVVGIPESQIIRGEAEVHYTDDVVFLQTAWEPTHESYENALEGRFDTTEVYFKVAGGFTVPWTKAKFKREHTAFMDDLIERIKKEDEEQKAKDGGKRNPQRQVVFLLEDEKLLIQSQPKTNQEDGNKDVDGDQGSTGTEED